MNQLNESLWGDEGFSALAVMNSFWETMGIMMRDTSPPGFYVLGWVWGRIFGYSEISLRSMSLLLMFGGAIFAGLIVYQIGKNKLNALLTSLLAFLSPFIMVFAFEWRMYALLTFSVMGSVYFFVARKWVGYVILTLLALYTHHFGLFTLFGEGIWFLVVDFKWKKPKIWLKQLWPFLLVVGLYLPWLYPFYTQLKRVQGSGFWLGVPNVKEVGEVLFRFITGGVKKEWRLLTAIVAFVVIFMKDWKKLWKPWFGLAIIFLAPVALAYVISYLVTPIFYDRYLLSVVMGMMVLLGLGTKKQFSAVLVVMIVIFGWLSWTQFTHPTKRPFRDMASVIKQEKKDGDVLINYNGSAHHLWESKYYGVPAPIYSPGGPLPLYVGTAQMKSEDVVYELPTIKGGRLGLITSDSVESVVLPGYKLVENKQFGQLSFSWWKKI